MGQADQSEIEEAVGRELSRMGIQGTLVLAGKTMELRSDGPPVSIDIEQILQQWALLPEEMRNRKADEIARRLATAQRASRKMEAPREAPADAAARNRVVSGVVGFFGLLFLIGLARYLIPRLTEDTPEPVSAPAELDTARTERLGRACDAVRENIYRGAAFGPLSMEGFVVELWLSKRGDAPIVRHAALAALLEDKNNRAKSKKLASSADARLAEIIDGTVEIVDGFDAEAARRSPGWSAAAVVFHEGYAREFFKEDNRPRFLGLADRAAAAVGAEMGALYARCAHGTTHDVGAWFRGPDLPGAAAAMVYAMGYFADAKLVDRGAIGVIKVQGGELDALRKAATDVAEAIPGFVGTAGGAITGSHPATLTFPLAAPVRAVSATRDMAKKMNLAPTTGE